MSRPIATTTVTAVSAVTTLRGVPTSFCCFNHFAEARPHLDDHYVSFPRLHEIRMITLNNRGCDVCWLRVPLQLVLAPRRRGTGAPEEGAGGAAALLPRRGEERAAAGQAREAGPAREELGPRTAGTPRDRGPRKCST